MSTFDGVMSRFPHHVQADINWQRSKLRGDELKLYEDYVIANRSDIKKILFYPPFFVQEKRRIDTQIFYQKHNLVPRDGLKCKHCGSNNTKTRQLQLRSGDESMTTIIYCYDCKQETKF